MPTCSHLWLHLSTLLRRLNSVRLLGNVMRKISEEEAFTLAGESECPVLHKEESDPMEAAVCLKQFPGGYVLGVSDKVRDLHMWFTTDLAEAQRHFTEHVRVMHETGIPFGPSTLSP
jgi:hypothetical protein